MATTKTLSVVVTGDASKAKAMFSSLGGDADEFGGRLTKAGGNISNGLAAAAGAMVAGVGLMLAGAFNAADESAKIGRETERVLKTTGAQAWTTADQVGDYAQELSELTGVDDEVIQSGENLLLTFTQIQNKLGDGNDVFDRATAAALDMSTALGTDMSGASIQVGKALNDPIKGITALSRAGVSFTAQQKEQIRTLTEAGDVLGAQKLILQELEKEFGGAAAAASTPLDKLKVTLDNLMEQMGTALLPIVGSVATAISGLVSGFAALPGPVQAVVVGVSALGAAGAGGIVVVAKLASVFGEVLGPALAMGRTLLDNAALGVANMATKFGVGQDSALKLASGVSGIGAALPVVGVAAMAGVAIWSMYSAQQEAVNRRAKDFIGTLDEQTGALTENTAAKIQDTFESKNLLDNLNEAGITVAAYSDAITDNTQALFGQREMKDQLISSYENGERATNATVEALRQEGGARNDLLATLLEQGQLDTDLIDTIYEQTTAYDANQQAVKERAIQQGIATGKTREAAEADIKAAEAASQSAAAIRDAAQAQREAVDPWFAAYKASQNLTTAQKSYNDAVKEFGDDSPEAVAAYVSLADSGFNYESQLLGLSEAQADGETSAEDLNTRLQALKAYGIDPTSTAAQIAGYNMYGLAGAADEANSRNVDIPVTAPGLDSVIGRFQTLAQAIRDTGREAQVLGPGISVRGGLPSFYADGGSVSDGWFVTGENGPEMGFKSGSTVEIFSNSESRAMVGGSGSTTTIVNVQVNGGDPDRIIEVIRQYERRNGTGWRN